MTLGERIIEEIKTREMNFSTFARNVLKLDYNIFRDITKHDVYSSRIAQKIAEILGEEYEQYIIPSTCLYCGKEFIGQLGKKYCSHGCNYKYNYRARANKPLPKFKQECNSVRSISEIEYEARDKNISYGQRMAMERLRSTYDQRS